MKVEWRPKLWFATSTRHAVEVDPTKKTADRSWDEALCGVLVEGPGAKPNEGSEACKRCLASLSKKRKGA